MAYNFVVADRDQRFLLPPDMADWLPADHLAWFVIDVVDAIDLEGFRRSYRLDGHGRAAYDPAMMVALLLYAYCSGVRSSRVIERRCVEDVAFRVLAGGHQPDHVTIARFRQRHADTLAGVFVDSLRLCAEAGLVRLGVVALDGTKIGADAVNGQVAVPGGGHEKSPPPPRCFSRWSAWFVLPSRGLVSCGRTRLRWRRRRRDAIAGRGG